MILDTSGVYVPEDMRDHSTWFNLSPEIAYFIQSFERLNAANILISLYADGCNQAATVSQTTAAGTINYFYRFCCGELYRDVGDAQDDPGTRASFETLDDLVCNVLGVTA